MFFIPSRTLHAIGPGILLAEVQQSSNVTYRIYDYGRLDADGKPRRLHIRQAVEVTDLGPVFDTVPVPLLLANSQDRLLASCPYFAVVRQQLKTDRRYVGDPNSFHALMCVEGKGQLSHAQGSFAVPAGATVFVPANSCPFTLSGEMTLLDVFVPDPALF